MNIAVIIPTIGKGMVDVTVNSLIKHTDKPFSIIIENDKNKTFAQNCNEGAYKVQYSDWLVFCNDDIIVNCDWISLIEKYKNKSNILGFKLLFPDNTIQHAGVEFNLQNGLPYHKLYKQPDRAIKSEYVPAVTGALMAIERNYFNMFLNGFSQKYKNGLEDIDLCLYSRRFEEKPFLIGESKIYHVEKTSRGTNKQEAEENIKIFKALWPIETIKRLCYS